MKKTILIPVIIALISLSLKSQIIDSDMLISTFSGKNAKLTFQTGTFENNSFTILVNINWVNSKLKSVKDKESVLAVIHDSVKIFPENSIGISEESTIGKFSNDVIVVRFFAKPEFEGGDVKITIPFVYAENIEAANNNKHKEVLYAKPKKPIIDYKIDGKLIKDIYPPLVKVTAPLPDKNKDEDIAIVETRNTEVRVSAYDKSGIKEIRINGVKAKYLYTGEYTAKLKLFTGGNLINIIATDNFGNESKTELELICSYQYELDLKGGQYYALIVGVNDYKDDNIPDLDKPIADAEALKNVLTSLYTFDENNVSFLKNPSRSDLINELDMFADKLNDNDNLLIFYAGHGFWDDFKEIGYWLPSDAETGDKSTWIRNSTIKDFIGAVKTKQTLLITDACFSGSIFKTRGLKAGNFVAYQKIYDMPGKKGMTSGTLKEVPDKSVFLNTLRKRLTENKDKYLLSSTLFNSLRAAVLNNSPNVPQFGTIQGVGDEGGEFIFILR